MHPALNADEPGVTGCGVRECIGDVATLGTTNWQSWHGDICWPLVGLHIMCVVTAETAHLVFRCMLLVLDERIFAVDCR